MAKITLSSDYEDLLKIFNKYRVKYLIVGAYAVIYYTGPRYTKDIDIWIKPDVENAKRVYRALKEFGVPLENVSVDVFTNKNLIYQIGVEPVRVDIIMSLAGIDFDHAWNRRKRIKYGEVSVNIINIKDLITAKRKLKRPNDIVDLEKLKLARRLKSK